MNRLQRVLNVSRKVAASPLLRRSSMGHNSNIGSAFCFSSSSDGSDKKNDKAPDEFYDEEVEDDKEFMDMISAVARGNGLGGLTTNKEKFSFDDIDEAGNSTETVPIGIVEALKGVAKGNAEASGNEGGSPDDPDSSSKQMVMDMLMHDDLAEHYGDINLSSNTLMPPEYMNYTVPWKKSNQWTPSSVPSSNFVKKTSKDSFVHDSHGLRSCPGKRQRKGQGGELGCHVIDLEKLSPFNLLTLRRFISVDSEILGRKDTRLCAKCQRKVAKTVKRARNLGIMGHIDEYVLQDSAPLQRGKTYHKQSVNGIVTHSKTIL